MAAFGIKISMANTRPLPSTRGSSAWVKTASRVMDSMTRAWAWYWDGKMSMIREIVSEAEFVCSVENVKWPVSATRRQCFDGLQVPHFSDQNDIGVLSQN